eukprot:scaffold24505_cov27-Tisochrysis_lutea.AAC.1
MPSAVPEVPHSASRASGTCIWEATAAQPLARSKQDVREGTRRGRPLSGEECVQARALSGLTSSSSLRAVR